MATETVWPEYMGLREIERYCGLSRTTIWRLSKTGELRVLRVGRSVRVRRVDLDGYLERNACPEVE